MRASAFCSKYECMNNLDDNTPAVRSPETMNNQFASALIMVADLTFIIKSASHRLCGKDLTINVKSAMYLTSRSKMVSVIRNTGFQFAGMTIYLDQNIQCKLEIICWGGEVYDNGAYVEDLL